MKKKTFRSTLLALEIIVISALIGFTIFETLSIVLFNQTYTFAATIHANANQTELLLYADYKEAEYLAIEVAILFFISFMLFIVTLKEYFKSD